MTLALFLVFVLAKLAAMAGHGIPVSGWSVLAFTWQDALVALAFAGVWRLTRGRSGAAAIVTTLYGALAIFALVNIPIGRALATPLTWPMLQATGGALADSLLLHATWTNLLLITMVAAAAAILPTLGGYLPRAARTAIALAAVPVIALGPYASARTDMQGRHRNPVVAMVQSGIPIVDARERRSDWRRSPFAGSASDDLSRFRGAAQGRNIVVVSLESTAAQYLRLYGGRDDVMPELGALAAQGLVFDRAYAAYPESIKGLFSVLCSTSPAFDVKAELLSRVPCSALPAILRNAGYETALFHSGRFDYLGMEAVIRHRGYDVLADAGDISGNHRSSFGVDEPSTVDRMLSWIDSLSRERPFFLTYLPIAGHHPYEAPAGGPFPNTDDFGRYRNALRYGDSALRMLVDGLRKRGLDRNTLWVIYGDHGEAFGQHDGNYAHTFLLFDENVRVPFIVAAPGLMTEQLRVRRPVSLVDTAPTILELVGIPVPGRYQGSSMLDAAQQMALFFTDYSIPLIGLVDGHWKAVHDLSTGSTRLFDLQRDPGETRAVSAPPRAQWYGRTLRDWSAAQKNYVLTATKNVTSRGSAP